MPSTDHPCLLPGPTGPVPGTPARHSSTALPHHWPLLYMVVGAVVGAGVIALYEAVALADSVLGHGIAGLRNATATAGRVTVWHTATHPWLVPLVVGAGALTASLLVTYLAPGASGHGTDAAIGAVHRDSTAIPASVSIVKICASAVLLGSGGSGGTEGPVTHISASLGSVLCRRLHIPQQQAWVLVTAALAAGVGALFRAPLAGAVLGVEILYVADATVEVLLPAALATAVAYAEFGAVVGYGPMYGQLAITVSWLRDIPISAGLGLVGGAAGWLYVTCFHRTEAFFRNLPASVPRLVRPALGGVAVGAIGVVLPAILGTGYGDVPVFLSRALLLHMAWWLVLLLPAVKIVSTSLSIGSGGSGGVFGPALIIGCAAGAASWRSLQMLGLGPRSPALFVIVCGAACLGAAVHAPIAVTIMACELFGDISLAGPCLVAVVVASRVVGPAQLYLSQRPTRAAEPSSPSDPVPAAEPTTGVLIATARL